LVFGNMLSTFFFLLYQRLTMLKKNTNIVSSMVHTGVEVCKMDSEMCGLVEWPWCYGMLWTLTFFFFFYLFFLILYFFSFEFLFLFPFIDNEEACDIAVTWCDVIGIEGGGRIWKMTSGHIYITWWPWGQHEEGA